MAEENTENSEDTQNYDDVTKEELIEAHEDVSEELETLKDEYTELEDKYLRTQAEFQNYQNRTEKQKDQLKERAGEDLIKELLPILDNFQLALNNEEGESFKDGMEMIFSQLTDVLHEQGLQKIETETTFDPNKHEAVLIDDEAPHNEIVEELQPGYKIGDKVIRHAKVKIGRNQG